MSKYKISYHIKNKEGKILQRDECLCRYLSGYPKSLIGYDFLSLVNCYDQIEDEDQIIDTWYEIDSIEEVSC